MSDAFDDAQEARFSTARDRHVARHLGISIEDLADHPYEIDEITLNDGTVAAWRVQWIGEPPPAAKAQGGPVEWWNEIPVSDSTSISFSATTALSIIAVGMTKAKEQFAQTSAAGPVSRMDIISIGIQMSRFMQNITSTLVSMEGHNLESLAKLKQATTVIDDFSAAILDAARWRFDYREGGVDE